jgi:hypothetical protein
VHRYRVYGLSVCSELELPELCEASVEGPDDVEVQIGRVADPPPEPSPHLRVRATPESAHFFWEDTGSVLVRGGRQIVVDPIPNVDQRELRLAVLGAGFSALLHQRGWLPLHGSVMDLHGQGAAFVGDMGAGKSTLAAALTARGHRLVADDVAGVSQEGRALVHPAYPQLKLWPQTLSGLGHDQAALPRLSASYDKRARRVDEGFSLDPLPLTRVYVLDRGVESRIEPISGQKALMALVRFSQAVQLNLLCDAASSAAHFRRCAQLAAQVEVSHLVRPWSLDRLDDVARMIEESMRARAQ